MKKISVIVNCYNGEEYLENCLNSILNQNFKNFEIIFFDNASTDNTNNIIKNFNDNRIKYFLSEKKLPLYHARNQALQKSSGELIAFLDVDDWWDKDYLSSREDEFNNTDYGIFYNNVFIFYEKDKSIKKYKDYNLPSGKIYDSLVKDYFIVISGLIIRKEVFNKIGKFNSNFNIIGDFDFVMKASRKFNFHALNKPLSFYRVHKKNFSKENLDIFFEEFSVWYQDQTKKNDEYFEKYKKFFKKKLLFLEINYLLLHKGKNFSLIKKILEYPNLLQKIKFMVGFILPNKISRLLKK